MSSQHDPAEFAKCWKWPDFNGSREHVAIATWLDDDLCFSKSWTDAILAALGSASAETRASYEREGNAWMMTLDDGATVSLIDRTFPAEEGPAQVKVEELLKILTLFRQKCRN